MDKDWLTRLAHAQSDDERAAIVLQMSLAVLPPALQTVVQAAAIPHWFDAQFLEALIGEAGDEWYDSLLTLNFVEQSPGRGYTIHERTRRQLLRNLWRDDPTRFRALSGKAADYCAAQAGEAQQAAAWQAEAVYHRLVSDPESSVAQLRDLATRWANYEYHTYDQIEATIRLAQEQIAAGRLTGDGANWTRLWQARLALLYGRADLAAAPLAEIASQPADDPYWAAELAQTQGDILAQTNDRDGLAAAWNAAYDLYQQQAEPQGRLDAYLLAEKMRQHGLPLPAAEAGEDTAAKTPPTSTALRLIDNISSAWIEGVLQPALQQTIDLRFARDGARPSNLVFHRPLTLDRPVAAGQRLSRLFAAAGESLLILGAPGSGKTITLLQLLDELLQAAGADARVPIPLLFNLSSFATSSQEKEATFTDWLIEQANTQYRLKRETMREWLDSGNRFTLLLDGLDEVRNESGQREQCIAAINNFMRRTPCGLVVCSRIGDYQMLQNRLELAHALVLQPLSNRQIENFIQQLESPDRAAMAQRIADDWQLREALRSPLLLNLYPQAFAALPAVMDAGDTVETRRQALFAAHVATAFARPAPGQAKDRVGNKEQSIGWLTFLANQIQQMGSSLFYVESLQPTWLPPKLIGRYRGLYGLSLGLVVGVIVGLIVGLGGGPGGGLVVWLSGGAAGGGATWLTTRLQKSWLRAGIGGVIFGLILWLLIGGLSTGFVDVIVYFPIIGLGMMLSLSIASVPFDIKLREQVKLLRPNRQRKLQYLKRGVRLGLIVGLSISLSIWLIAWLSFWLIAWLRFWLTGEASVEWSVWLNIGLSSGLSSGLAGMLSGVLVGTLSGFVMAFLDTPVVDKRPYPGKGSRSSIRNALVMTTLAACFFGLPLWLIDRVMFAELMFLYPVMINIQPPIFTWFGGLAWCQHWALRFMLARQGWLPWRLVLWLEEMAARGLLRRVGGGYIFIHRSLLEYFAMLEGPHMPGESPASRQGAGRAVKTDRT